MKGHNPPFENPPKLTDYAIANLPYALAVLICFLSDHKYIRTSDLNLNAPIFQKYSVKNKSHLIVE